MFPAYFASCSDFESGSVGTGWGQFTDKNTDNERSCQDRLKRPVNAPASASCFDAEHVHSVACGTPADLLMHELEPLYDLSVAAALIPCSTQRLKNFLGYRKRLFPARYRLESVQNARHRRRVRLLYAAEIRAARRHILRRSKVRLLFE